MYFSLIKFVIFQFREIQFYSILKKNFFKRKYFMKIILIYFKNKYYINEYIRIIFFHLDKKLNLIKIVLICYKSQKLLYYKEFKLKNFNFNKKIFTYIEYNIEWIIHEVIFFDGKISFKGRITKLLIFFYLCVQLHGNIFYNRRIGYLNILFISCAIAKNIKKMKILKF